jgi:hypothetical protein
MATIQFNRGDEANLPTLAEGEPAFTLDTEKLFIGGTAGNVEIGGGSGYTDEEAQDAVGTILADSATINFTYTDGTPEITASVILDTDGTLAANSDTVIASQKAVKTYVDGLMTANDAMVFMGVIDCSTNPNYPAADSGHTYRVSVAGKIGGASGPNVEAGDVLICLTDGTTAGNHATVGASWGIIQVNIDGALTTTAIGSTVQAYDATLTALAGLTIASNSLTIGTGADAFSQTTFAANTFLARASTGDLSAKPISDFGLGFVNVSDMAAGQAYLGVEPGVNVQPNNAYLTDISSFITPPADRIVFLKASGPVMDLLTLGTGLSITGTTLNNTSVSPTVATQAQQEAGTDLTTFVPPGRQQFHPSAVKAWVRFNMIGVWAIGSSYGVSSVTDNGVGIGTIGWTTAFSTATYPIMWWGDSDLATHSNANPYINETAILAGAVSFRTNSSAGAALDYNSVTVMASGDQ